ncbi:MAG TPA: protein-L-isoaspartate(D-aspartate) O-methyltransferase [Methylocystis sp.]|nr:protein-L-isoaspartate(D-aspartate) O-methyltransferase [Methylocystis sp.]
MSFPGAELPLEARAALALQLRRANVRSVKVMRAIELAPRALFAPHRFKDLAARDVALPIGCGQTMPSAADLAWRLDALDIEPKHRVLEIGSGSGYATTVLSLLAGEVESVERFQTLALGAARRLADLGVENARVACADGLDIPRSAGRYDRIILHVALDAVPQSLFGALAADGLLAYGRRSKSLSGPTRARWIKVARFNDEAKETDLGPCRLPAALLGRAGVL